MNESFIIWALFLLHYLFVGLSNLEQQHKISSFSTLILIQFFLGGRGVEPGSGVLCEVCDLQRILV